MGFHELPLARIVPTEHEGVASQRIGKYNGIKASPVSGEVSVRRTDGEVKFNQCDLSHHNVPKGQFMMQSINL